MTKKGAGARSSGGGGRSFLNEAGSTKGKEEDENGRRRQFSPFFFHRFLRKTIQKNLGLFSPFHHADVASSPGRESTLQFLILKYVLNYPDVRIYEGSWVEWSAAKNTPAEVGPDRSVGSGAVSS